MIFTHVPSLLVFFFNGRKEHGCTLRNTEADLVVLPKEILMAMRRDESINEVLRLLIHSDIFLNSFLMILPSCNK